MFLFYFFVLTQGTNRTAAAWATVAPSAWGTLAAAGGSGSGRDVDVDPQAAERIRIRSAVR